jgi:hypothetical protein
MHADMISDLPHADAKKEGRRHGLTPVRISALETCQRVGKPTAPGLGDFAQTFRQPAHPDDPLGALVDAEEGLLA